MDWGNLDDQNQVLTIIAMTTRDGMTDSRGLEITIRLLATMVTKLNKGSSRLSNAGAIKRLPTEAREPILIITRITIMIPPSMNGSHSAGRIREETYHVTKLVPERTFLRSEGKPGRIRRQQAEWTTQEENVHGTMRSRRSESGLMHYNVKELAPLTPQ